MYQSILKKFLADGIHLNDEQHEFLKIIEKYQPRKFSFINNFRKQLKNGCYIFGDVGRGKTMILNSIYNEIKNKKCSYHYIEFMRFVHSELVIVKKTKDPLLKVAKRISSKYEVVFIDEFQIEDVSDAMIVGELLNLLSNMNVFLMITSNVNINNLYRNGLQREKFIKQMQKLEKSLILFEFTGEKDYRLKNIDLHPSQKTQEISDEQILDFINKNFSIIGELQNEFLVNERKFICKGVTKDFIWISYREFFRQNLAISDFLSICKNYEWFFIDDFEQNDDYGKDIIRRFIGFIDIAYIEKAKIKFFIKNEDIRNLYNGNELNFLWDRTLSRLEEMRNIN
tara:strand:- start:7267 stop:8286 length:1020 start_codon:yes stop_codon:yes gene_type:complete